MAKSESSGESANFKKVALGVIILLVLGMAAYFLVKSEFFQGLIPLAKPVYDVEMAKVKDAVTVREDCAEGEDFCTWPIETKKETSFDVKKDAVFEVLQGPDGAPSGTLRALKAEFEEGKHWEISQPDEAVAFHNSSTEAGTEIVQWCYSFGDDETSCLNVDHTKTVHSYTKTDEDQEYNVTLTVNDAAGRSDSFTTTITIPAKEVAEQDIEAVCKSENDPKTVGLVHFRGTLQNADGTDFEYAPEDYTWQWGFKDGLEDGEGQRVSHNYTPGTYNPTLEVTDSEGNVYNAQCSKITVLHPGPGVRPVPTTGRQMIPLNSVLNAATSGFPIENFNPGSVIAPGKTSTGPATTEPADADSTIAPADAISADGDEATADNSSAGGLTAQAGSTVYFEADCSELDKALLITTVVQEKPARQPRPMPTGPDPQPRRPIPTETSPLEGILKKRDIPVDPIEGFNLGGKIERPADIGIIEAERGEDTSIASGLTSTNAKDVQSRLGSFTTGEIVTATLGIRANEFACIPPIEEPPVQPACKVEGESLSTQDDVCCDGLVVGPDDYNDALSFGRCQAPQEQPVVPICNVDKNAILTGEDIVFTGRGSSGPYVKAVLSFGDGTDETADIELNVPTQEAELDISDIPTEVIEGLKEGRKINQFNGRIAKRIPMEDSLGKRRETPPVIKIKQTDIDEVQTFQTHTYGTAGTFTITLTLVDKDGQAKTCDTSVDVADPVVVDPVPPQCSDGLDNDGDEFIDFIVGAGDPGCDDPADDDETNKKEIITDEPPRLPFCLAYTTPERYVDVSTQNNAYDVIKEESSTAYNGAYEDFVGQAIFHGYKTANNKRVFKPQQGILRSEAAKIVMHATCYADALLEYGLLDDTNIPYKDVPATHWADQIINIMSNAGIFDADKDYNYPNSHTTRAEFIKLLVEVHVQTVGDELHAFRADENPFVDVEAGAWYAPYIQTAVDYGIALESDDFTFRPDRIVTREDAAIWIYNYFAAVADATFGEKREGETDAPESEAESGRVAPIRR